MSGIGDEEGSGSVAGVAVVAFASVLLCGVAVIGGAVAELEQLRGAADAGALAAADAASGRIAGVPCELVAAVAQRLDAAVSRCTAAEAGVVEVVLTRPILGIPIDAAARAGPPPQ
ncbi:Rv3654c family TadE-like protein [Herbiconiux liukaitaii]|uniref:Rv3654c family TadE-like protein n=1 Tax=Herbiconiux liukaitaii TaxID=3342799 RepID=UPI0035B7BCE8